MIQHEGAINTITNLADRSFTHVITSTNPITYYNDLNPFAYVATN